jgi:N utilization substance protein B
MSGPRNDVRHRARESALQILYHWDIAHTGVQEAADTFFDRQWAGSEPPSDELRAFATELATETVSRLDGIDVLIAETTERWRPERMAVVDRLVLRMATCEFLRGAGVPPAVIINEALELARTFSTEESVKFINGMLDGVRKKIAESR